MFIVIEGKGALSAPDDTAKFADRVHQLLLKPEHRFELGKLAKSYALDKWTATLQAQRMIKFYEEIILSPSTGQPYLKRHLASIKG